MNALFQAISWILARCYDLVPNYGFAIVMLTLAVMLLLFPLVQKQTVSLAMMGRLAPEVKRLQKEHKADKQKQSEALMALYAENHVHPLSGCLPLVVQMPVFIVLYNVIRGLSHTAEGTPEPKYLSHASKLYRSVVADEGALPAWGMNLADTASEALRQSVATGAPFLLLVGAVMASSYWQQHMISRRNPPAGPDNPMMQQMQLLGKIMPIGFGIVSFTFPAALVVYFLVSNLFRIGQQWFLFRTHPVLRDSLNARLAEAHGKTVEAKGKEVGTSPKAIPAEEDDGKKAAKPKPKAPPSPKGDNGKAPAPRTSGRVTPSGSNGRRSKNKKKSKRGR